MKILVVDDDPLAAAMIAAVLEDLGHTALLAENAIEAAEQLNADSAIALVISVSKSREIVESLGSDREALNIPS